MIYLLSVRILIHNFIEKKNLKKSKFKIMSTSGNEAVDSFKSKSPVNSGSNKNRQIKNSTKEDEICDNWEQLDPQVSFLYLFFGR